MFKHSQIGIITLINATPMDAQSIFSRINKGGTQLKPEELLSAKPFWNKQVYGCDDSVKRLIDHIYSLIGIPPCNDVVRWDIAATLIDRLERDREYPLLFGKRDDNLFIKRVTQGFKLLSTLMEKGCSNKHVLALEKKEHDDDNWQSRIDDYVEQLNMICALLHEDELFGTLSCLGCPMTELPGEGPTWEWIVTLFESWNQLENPKKGHSRENHLFRQRARIHFDKLLYEKLSGIWKGTSDSRMATNVRNWEQRIHTRVNDALWENILESACHGIISSRSTSKKDLKPILYYAAALRGTSGPMIGSQFDIDHIIPEAKLVENSQIPETFKDSLSNLTLLPWIENRRKNATLIKDLDNLLREKAMFTCGIETPAELDLFSDCSRHDDIIRHRCAFFKKVFTQRSRLLSQA